MDCTAHTRKPFEVLFTGVAVVGVSFAGNMIVLFKKMAGGSDNVLVENFNHFQRVSCVSTGTDTSKADFSSTSDSFDISKYRKTIAVLFLDV